MDPYEAIRIVCATGLFLPKVRSIRMYNSVSFYQWGGTHSCLKKSYDLRLPRAQNIWALNYWVGTWSESIFSNCVVFKTLNITLHITEMRTFLEIADYLRKWNSSYSSRHLNFIAKSLSSASDNVSLKFNTTNSRKPFKLKKEQHSIMLIQQLVVLNTEAQICQVTRKEPFTNICEGSMP